MGRKIVPLFILNLGIEILLSDIDYQFILGSSKTWHLSGWGYIFRGTGKDAEYLHILIAKRMGLNTNNLIDHINRNKLDNNRENLRESNKSLNGHNSKIGSNNTSGVTGVHFHKSYNKWWAYIDINSRRINLGYFENKEDAIKARAIAESQI